MPPGGKLKMMVLQFFRCESNSAFSGSIKLFLKTGSSISHSQNRTDERTKRIFVALPTGEKEKVLNHVHIGVCVKTSNELPFRIYIHTRECLSSLRNERQFDPQMASIRLQYHCFVMYVVFFNENLTYQASVFPVKLNKQFQKHRPFLKISRLLNSHIFSG